MEHIQAIIFALILAGVSYVGFVLVSEVRSVQRQLERHRDGLMMIGKDVDEGTLYMIGLTTVIKVYILLTMLFLMAIAGIKIWDTVLALF